MSQSKGLCRFVPCAPAHALHVSGMVRLHAKLDVRPLGAGSEQGLAVAATTRVATMPTVDCFDPASNICFSLIFLSRTSRATSDCFQWSVLDTFKIWMVKVAKERRSGTTTPGERWLPVPGARPRVIGILPKEVKIGNLVN